MLLLPKRGRRPVDTKTKLYDTFVLPHLDYCFALWQECSKELQCRVDQIQNYGMRLILSKPLRTQSEGLRQKLKWPHLGKHVLSSIGPDPQMHEQQGTSSVLARPFRSTWFVPENPTWF